jgi:hypothetical protein
MRDVTHSAWFSWGFLGTVVLTLALFGAAEMWPVWRQPLAAAAAMVEGVVFVLLAWVLWQVRWGGGVPGWLMALLPLCGAVFAWRLAYRRMAGMEV